MFKLPRNIKLNHDIDSTNVSLDCSLLYISFIFHKAVLTQAFLKVFACSIRQRETPTSESKVEVNGSQSRFSLSTKVK